MGTADGTDHRRLRGPLAKAYTARRGQAFASRIAEITDGLLDEIGRTAAGHPDQEADLKALFATPLPIGVICELFGVHPDEEAALHVLCDRRFDTTSTSAAVAETEAGLHAFMTTLLAAKEDEPADDLTSALIRVAADSLGCRSTCVR